MNNETEIVNGGLVGYYFKMTLPQFVMLFLVIFGILCFLAATNKIIHSILWLYVKISSLAFWILFLLFCVMAVILIVECFYYLSSQSGYNDSIYQQLYPILSKFNIISLPSIPLNFSYFSISFNRFLDFVGNATKPTS
jgi:hypothetical protein